MAVSETDQRLAKLEAVLDVQNLIGRYEFLHAANMHRRCLPLYALDTPGVRIEMDWGVFEGRAGVERFFLGYHGGHEAEDATNDLRGDMHMHAVTTPVIEVADDLRTARGVWISPGHETIPLGPGGTMKAFWIWLKYSYEFVVQDGSWKIWKQSVHCTFMSPYERSWAAMDPMPPRRTLPADKAPDRCLPQPPPWTYAPGRQAVDVPAPPEPYASSPLPPGGAPARPRERALERIEAAHAISHTMSRYSYAHAAGHHHECLELHALDTPGVRAELPFGVYEGRAGLERLYLGFFGEADRTPEGRMHVTAMTTPVIEVAGDRRTARGVWLCPGHATDRFGGSGDAVRASWRWTSYEGAFVREDDGRWRIRHLRVHGIFATPYDTGWVETGRERARAGRPAGPPPMPEEYRPDRAAAPFRQYSEDEARPYEPVLPEPYETWGEVA